jgi:hypothetical protein
MKYTRETIQKALQKKGYVYFEDKLNKGFDVNIIGVRNSSSKNIVTNLFDDILTLSYKENGVWQYKEWQITTDPGTKAVQQFHNINGVARVVPGQYRSVHKIGLHKGKYEALTQQKDISVFRDANKDMTFDETKIQTGVFGINIHHAGADSSIVSNWSEGCQVFKRIKDFNEFMAICRKAKDIHGNSFTYTLITSNDLI